jgi:hypothetical protein
MTLSFFQHILDILSDLFRQVFFQVTRGTVLLAEIKPGEPSPWTPGCRCLVYTPNSVAALCILSMIDTSNGQRLSQWPQEMQSLP